MKKKKVANLQKYDLFLSTDENYRNEKLLALIERKNKLKADRTYRKMQAQMEEERRAVYRIGDDKDIAIVDFQDKQELYFQVLKTLRNGESEYFKKNPKTDYFELVMNLKLQN